MPTRGEHPFCTRRELRDGTYTVNDLYDFHEIMAEEAEYHRRMKDAADAIAAADRARNERR